MTNPVPEPVTPARDQIVAALRWGPATVDELAELVGLTPNGVRAHLAVLQRDETVEALGVRPTGGAGKPPTLYGLTRSAEEKLSAAYPGALLALVAALRDSAPPEVLRHLLSEAGVRLAEVMDGDDAAALLGRLGAAVRSRVDADGVTELRGASCPLATAVREERATCEMVRSMLETRLGREVEICCRYGDQPRCGFRISAGS
jgi:predicted ArsR family transcriptional regulator